MLLRFLMLYALLFAFQITFSVAQTTEGDSLLMQARVFRSENKIENAIKSYIKAERKFENQGLQTKIIQVKTEIGLVFDSLGVHDKAREYYLESFNKSTDTKVREKLLLYIAESYFKSGGTYIRKSIDFYLRVLSLSKMSKNENKQIKTLNAIASAYSHPEINQLDTAYQYRKDVVRLESLNNNPTGLATAWNNLAYTNRLIASREISKNNKTAAADTLKNALIYIENALANKQDDKEIQENKIITMINLAVIEQSLGKDAKALDLFDKVMQIRKQQKNTEEIARTHNLIAKLHYYQQRYTQARENAETAVLQAKKTNAKPVMQTSYEILADISEKLADFRKLSKYKDSLYNVRNDLSKNEIIDQQKQAQYKDITSQEITNALTEEKEEAELQRQKAEAKIAKAEAERQKAEAEKQRAEADKERAKAQTALEQKKNAEVEAARQRAEAQTQKAEAARQKADAGRQRAEAERQKADAETQKEKARTAEAKAANEKQQKQALIDEQNRKNQLYGLLSVIGFGALILLFILISYYRNQQKNKILKAQNHKIQEQNDNLEIQKKEIEEQRDNLIELNEEINQQKEEIETQRDLIEGEKVKADKLLLNILPLETAMELKEKGRATPKSYQLVTVLFTDFKGFTVATEHMNPTQVIEELDKCFGAFDLICEKYGLEKIKTIGDAFMCAGGIPVPNTTNPIDAVRAGLEIQTFMQTMREERLAKGEKYWELRVGINSGPCVAGVVGSKKFAYDIWGDTVNTASRMESSGEPNKVNISGKTYELVKNYFECEYRGKLPAKNKGDVDMYFVVSER